MANHEPHFYAGNSTGLQPAFPLARFLPPLPPGMVSAWLAENISPGGWLIDPLGASPALTLEAAQAGYRVLVASNNPILSFITETLAKAPKSADFQSALAELAMARRGEDRLDQHLQRLYLTECDTCGEPIQVQAFLWRKGESKPFARLYECPKCGQSGEHPVNQADLERLEAMGGDKLQRSRALQRVILNEDEHRADVEEALENYLSRPLYFLFTLVNKLEGLGLPLERMRLLQALLISAFDQGSTLWPWPTGRPRPKQLITPPQFRENNLWLAVEDAVKEWAHQPGPVTVTHWPELLPEGSGGICLFHGRVKALMPLSKEIGLRAVLTAFPRPNQAFWTLSALWSGWLWGAEAALPLRNVLDRRRYDWNWHTSAIHSALSAVGGNISTDIPFYGLLPELTPGFLSAVMVAAEAASFHLDGLATRSSTELAIGIWRPSSGAMQKPPERKPAPQDRSYPEPGQLENITGAAIRADLLARNEPAPYIIEYSAGLAALARSGALPGSVNNIPGDLLPSVQSALARVFADRAVLKLYGGPAEEERGVWWLAKKPGSMDAGTNLPLADRIEMEVVRFMQKQPVFTFEELDQRICALFPGLLTPPTELVRACLESYGEPLPGSNSQLGTWHMRSSETAAARKVDLQEIRSNLAALGKRLDFSVSDRGSALVWEQNSVACWQFYLMASAILSRFVLNGLPEPIYGQRILVLPGSRARLLGYKLRRDPRLAEALAQNPPWRFLKFRHLREIAGQAHLTSDSWESLIDEDPLTGDATQLQLFTGPQSGEGEST